MKKAPLPFLVFVLVVLLPGCVIYVPTASNAGSPTLSAPQATQDRGTPEPGVRAQDRERIRQEIAGYFEEGQSRVFSDGDDIIVDGAYCVQVEVLGTLVGSEIYAIDKFAAQVEGERRFFVDENEEYVEYFTLPSFACATSRDGSLRAESIGMYQDGPGGLHELRRMRIIALPGGETLWAAASGLSNAFLWSPDSRYVCVEYAGRTWRSADIVEGRTGITTSLPGLESLRQIDETIPAPSAQRPDLEWRAKAWINESILQLELSYSMEDAQRVLIVYEYDIGADALAIVSVDLPR